MKMNMSLEMFEKTRELGECVVRSQEYVRVQEASDACAKDELAVKMLGEFDFQKTAIQQMMQAEEPDQAAIAAAAEKLRHTQAELENVPSIKRLNEAQADFRELLTQVNQILDFVITGKIQDGNGCSGNCSSCGKSCSSADDGENISRV